MRLAVGGRPAIIPGAGCAGWGVSRAGVTAHGLALPSLSGYTGTGPRVAGGGSRPGRGWWSLGGVEDQRAGLGAVRRRLAERLALELARARRGRHGLGSDFLAATAVQVTLESTPWLRAVLERVAGAAGEGSADVGSVFGDTGLVFFVHGRGADNWSVVFPFLPFTRMMLVCIDDLEGHCLQLLDDGEEAGQLSHEVVMAASVALAEGRVAPLPGVPPGPPGEPAAAGPGQ
jgi:hypothetical protein